MHEAARQQPKPRRIYVASSWRNVHQQSVVATLRRAGHQVYDFRHPRTGDTGFKWSEVDTQWESWDRHAYRKALTHPAAWKGFNNDYAAMQWADTGVLVLPSGRSAHIEAGYFNGAGKDLYILQLEDMEPELMYLMATALCLSVDELMACLAQ